MYGPLITSLITNFLLFMLLILLLIFYIAESKKVVIRTQQQVCPIRDFPVRISTFDTRRPYILKTLSGLYVQSCFECLPTPVSCFNQGIVASDEWNGDTIELLSAGGTYIMKLNSKLNPDQNYYLYMVRVNESYVLCMTQNSNDPAALFEIFPYVISRQDGTNLYQIGTPISRTLIGESDPSCLVQNGVSIVDGYNISPNAPRGMDEKSFFMLLPAK